MGREFRRGESHKFDGASAHRKTNCRLYAQMQGACPPIRFFASEARSQGRPLANAGLSLSYAASYRRSRKVHSFLIITRRNERLEESRIIAITHFAIHEKYKGEGIPLLPSIKWIH